MLISSSPARVERVLRMAIAAAVGSVPLVGCLGSPCGGGNFQSQSYAVTLTPCATDAGGVAPDGGVCATTCGQACMDFKPDTLIGFGECADFDAGSVTLPEGTSVTVQCKTVQECTGRKLDGLSAPLVAGATETGAWLARAAWLEASAIFAFRRLARELRAHGAPRGLIKAARTCARDEVRHARAMMALAKKRGATVPPVPRVSFEVRDLEAIAKENAVEGCVSETYGAAVAAWQARSSNDPEIARVMKEIAPDELRHAAVGWAVHAWIDRRLGREARERVRAARDEAARALVEQARATREEHALASAIAEHLWAA
jgi:rubrerythrin